MKAFKKFFLDFIYGAIGLIALNGVVSLVIYPMLERQYGAAGQGRILFFTAIMGLVASALGSGANYARMKAVTLHRDTANGEFNIFLVFIGIVSIVITMVAVALKGDSGEASVLGLIVLIFTTAVRYYADVQFRLDLQYKRFSLYYLLIAGGYGLGLLLYPLTHSWIMIFLTGELVGLLYVAARGTIFKPPFFKVSTAAKQNWRLMFSLSGSFVLSDFVSYSDRLLLPLLVMNGDELTSIYYYASLIGKMMSLVSTPLNGVLTGHIAKSEKDMTKKRFALLALVVFGIGMLVTVVSVLGSHVFVYLFYNDYYEIAKPLFFLANAGQVFFFICNTMMVIVLRYTHERNQVIMGVIYLVSFAVICVPLIITQGIWGMAWGLFIINMIKFITISLLGYFGIKEKKNGKEEVL